ncbi:Phage-shock protein [Pseudomonas sp. IT-P171]
MALIRFLLALLIFIGVLASTSAIVLAVILMLRFPLILISVGLACLLFHLVFKRLHRTG